MIPETRFTLIKVFSVSFGLNIPASTTLARSDIKTKSKQDPNARILYKIGLLLSDALTPMAAVQANQNKKTFGLSTFIK